MLSGFVKFILNIFYDMKIKMWVHASVTAYEVLVISKMMWQCGHNTIAIYTNQQSNWEMDREVERWEHILKFFGSEAGLITAKVKIALT